MAEGNDFFNVLVWPAVERLLRPRAGERLLDVACGNGVTSRRLANAKASITAFDFSEPMIHLARKRSGEADIDYRIIRSNGRFVFSVIHPCFNNPATVQMGELEDRAGTLVTTYSVKISRYLTPHTQVGLAMHGQPVPHPYFHRPLSALLAPALEAGLVLDAIEECALPPEHAGGSTPLSWNGRFSEIPAALVVRVRSRPV